VVDFLSAAKLNATPSSATGKQKTHKSILSGVVTWEDLYQKYVKYVKNNKPIASAVLFREIRKKEFPELRKEMKTDLGECKIDVLLGDFLHEGEGSTEDMHAARELRTRHLTITHNDTHALAQVEATARSTPSDILVIKLDASVFPDGFPVYGRTISGAEHLEAGFIGCHMIHGDYESKTVYVVFKDVWPKAKGCDFWLSAMMDQLSHYLVRFAHRPRVLFLHTDNTVRSITLPSRTYAH